MNYNKKSVLDADVRGKKVLLRCDFNVPQNKETGAITSDKRIVAALPTIKYLLENGAAVIACSHLGKPKGEWKQKLTLAPVAERLSELLGQKVIFANDIIGDDAKAKAAALKPGEIMLLENRALISVRRKTAQTLQRLLPTWPRSMSPTLSARCTVHTHPPQALRRIFPHTQVCSLKRSCR